MNVGDPLSNAFARAFLLALIAAGATFFALLATFSGEWLPIIAATGGAFFGTFSARVGEGAIDSRNPIQREADARKAH